MDMDKLVGVEAATPPGLVLVVGGTGLLGSEVTRRLVDAAIPTRAMVRPTSDASGAALAGVEIVRGDLRDPTSLASAVTDVTTVITTANSIGRRLMGERSLDMAAVDDAGNAALIDAAERAGVARFIFLSLGGPALGASAPFPRAKRRTEARLARSGMRTVVIRPDAFQEIWLSPAVSFDPAGGRVVIFGRGRTRVAYVAVPDVAAATVALAQQLAPPAVVELGGPEALTRLELVEAFERALGRRIARRHVPRPVLAAGAVLLSPIRPELASSMAMAYAMDSRDSGLGPATFEKLGITPRPVSAYIETLASQMRRA
jgi:uncharacterized protein YbjT (DUF2867 family)